MSRNRIVILIILLIPLLLFAYIAHRELSPHIPCAAYVEISFSAENILSINGSKHILATSCPLSTRMTIENPFDKPIKLQSEKGDMEISSKGSITIQVLADQLYHLVDPDRNSTIKIVSVVNLSSN